jgi:hypothetical protein
MAEIKYRSPAKNLREMYERYIIEGNDSILADRKKKFDVAKPKAKSQEPGWGDISEVEDEEEVVEDSGEVIEPTEEDEEESAQQPEKVPLADEEEDEEEPAQTKQQTSRRNLYEEEIIKQLEEAKQKLLTPKQLGIADILGAGSIRKSADLIRSTQAENEERAMKAQDLALDILMRKSKSEQDRAEAEAREKYQQELLEVRKLAAGKVQQDPSQVRADKISAKAMFPNLPEDQAYAKYLREVKYRERPSAPPRPALITRMAQIRNKIKNGTATPDEIEELRMYDEEKKRSSSILDYILRQQENQ